MPYVNIHGQPITHEAIRAAENEYRKQRYLGMVPPSRKPTVKNGYAAPPGTGPASETCKTCKFKVSCGGPKHGRAKSFIKCELRRATWTHGEGTDILAGSPACSKWEKKD